MLTPNQKVARIILETAMHHQVKFAAMRGERRDQHTSRARMEAMWRIRTELRFSLPHIGRIFNRDHTTVIHAVRKVEEAIAESGQWVTGNKKPIYGPFDPFDRAQVDSVAKPVRRIPLPDIPVVAKARRQAAIINSFWASRGIKAKAHPVAEKGGRIIIKSDIQMVT